MFVIEIDITDDNCVDLSLNDLLNTRLNFNVYQTGDKGENGKTPIKGVDYFTEDDKAELINSIELGNIDAAAISIDDIKKLL